MDTAMDETNRDVGDDLVEGVSEDTKGGQWDDAIQRKAVSDDKDGSDAGPFRALEASRRRSRQSLKLFYLIALCLIAFVLAVVFFGKPKEESSKAPIVRQEDQQPTIRPTLPALQVEQKPRVPPAPEETPAAIQPREPAAQPAEGKEPPVLREAPVQKPDTAKTPAPSLPAGKFTVNVGSFEHKSGAEKFAQSLSDKGYDAFVQQVTIPQKGIFHRVSVGRFPTREKAEAYAQTLREKEKIKGFVREIDDKG